MDTKLNYLMDFTFNQWYHELRSQEYHDNGKALMSALVVNAECPYWDSACETCPLRGECLGW